MQPVCSPSCALEKVRRDKRKQNKKDLRDFNLKHRTKPQWIKITQAIHNKYVRLRDKDEPCISCGRYEHGITVKSGHGHKFDCGHYLSVGARPELRFTEGNSAKQCCECNGGAGNFTGKDYTVQKAYRVNLIKKIGIERVEWLEGPHPMPHWTNDDIKEIGEKYKAKIKLLTQGENK